MKSSSKPLHDLVGAFGLSLLFTACIINTVDDDGGIGESTDDGTPPSTQPPPGSTMPPDDTGNTTNPGTTTTPPADSTAGTTGSATDTEDTGATTGGPMGECTENLLSDPSFEAGTPNPSWDEASLVFESPICDANCTTERGAAPYAGDWWVWLGGLDDEAEVGSVSQTVTIEPETAYVEFWFQIRSGSGTGDDFFTVTIDGNTVFMVDDLLMDDYDDYTYINVDVSRWADGGMHELSFTGDIAGTGLTSFFVDETSVVSCIPSSASSGTTDTGGQDTDSSSTGTTGATGTTTGSGSGSSSG